MRINRVVIRNFRSFGYLDVPISELTTCVIGENNTGKTNFLHAIRLCIDSALSSAFRSLLACDIHSGIDISHPNQVLIGLEINDFAGKINEESLVSAWQFRPNEVRLIYRFRPKKNVREDLEYRKISPGSLSLEDYQWEITAGGDPAYDLAAIAWDEDVGTRIHFGDLQAFLVVYLPALRDVESELRQYYRSSPLARLIDAMQIDPIQHRKLLNVLRNANETGAADSSLAAIAKAIDESFDKVTGLAFKMSTGSGISEPTFQSVVPVLRMLLTNAALHNLEPTSNGPGLNSILYVSILVEWLHKRTQQKSAGQIILFEEPESHLDPQLQLTLFEALKRLPFQSILTTHSTHITSNAGLSSYVVLTPNDDGARVESSALVEDAGLEETAVKDLERYLDATKSNLLLARKVMLVEGPAELFLIPAFLKEKGIYLDRLGVSIIPIYGVHFDAYAALFNTWALPKKCAIVTDADLSPDDADDSIEGEDELIDRPDLKELEGEFVKVFSCQTTFERACIFQGTLEMFARTATDVGATTVAKRLREGLAKLEGEELSDSKRQEILNPLRDAVLNTARRFGKARFAQIAARHASQARTMPKYIYDAAVWLSDSETDDRANCCIPLR